MLNFSFIWKSVQFENGSCNAHIMWLSCKHMATCYRNVIFNNLCSRSAYIVNRYTHLADGFLRHTHIWYARDADSLIDRLPNTSTKHVFFLSLHFSSAQNCVIHFAASTCLSIILSYPQMHALNIHNHCDGFVTVKAFANGYLATAFKWNGSNNSNIRYWAFGLICERISEHGVGLCMGPLWAAN